MRTARLLTLAAGLMLPATALAQPAATDLGTLSAGVPVVVNIPQTPSGVINWYTITLDRDISYSELRHLTIGNTLGTGTGGSADSEIAVYDAAGNLILWDDDDGNGLSSELSFGTGTGVLPNTGTTRVIQNGRDGDLPAGLYYVACAYFGATWNTTNWSVTPGTTVLYATDLTIEYNDLTPPAEPAGLVDLGALSFGVPINSVGNALAASSIKWFKVSIPSTASNALASYVDMDTEGSSLAPTNDTTLAVYGISGALNSITTRQSNTTLTSSDTDDGSGTLSALSFGLVTPNRPAVGNGVAYNGRDGYLRTGVYYIGVGGPGTTPSTTAASGTNFGFVSTSANSGTVNLNINGAAPSVSPSGTGTVSPVFGGVGQSATVRVTVTGGVNPPSTGLAVSLNAASIDGGTVALLDNGVAPDVTAGDKIFSGTVTVGPSAGNGAQTMVATISDAQARSSTANINFTVVGTPPACASGNESFTFTNAISDGALNGGANTVVNFTATGGYDVGQVRFTGRYIPGNAFSSNARIRVTAPGGSFYDATPIVTNGTTGVPQDVSVDVTIPCVGLPAAGGWEVRFYESVDDTGVDGTWANACFTLVASGGGPSTAWTADACGTDAGDLPGSEQVPVGTGPLTTILGNTSTSDVDMYRINICDVNTFNITTSAIAGDTQLFLFRTDGTGVVFNDDDTAVAGSARIDNTVAALTTPGDYLLAVNRYNKDPLDAGGLLMWNNTGPTGSFLGQRVPDGPGAANAIASWTTAVAVSSGNYQLTLTGVCYPTGGGGGGCNLADITEVGGTEEAPGNPDQQLTVDDLILFVNLFSSQTGCPGTAPCNRADVTGIGGGGAAPDGELTVDDLIEFVNAFSTGC